jgi:hypothetical protein
MRTATSRWQLTTRTTSGTSTSLWPIGALQRSADVSCRRVVRADFEFLLLARRAKRLSTPSNYCYPFSPYVLLDARLRHGAAGQSERRLPTRSAPHNSTPRPAHSIIMPSSVHDAMHLTPLRVHNHRADVHLGRGCPPDAPVIVSIRPPFSPPEVQQKSTPSVEPRHGAAPRSTPPAAAVSLPPGLLFAAAILLPTRRF